MEYFKFTSNTGQTDEKEIGYSYGQMEPYVLNLYNGGNVNPNDSISQFVHRKHIENKHKHEGSLVFNLRKFC